MVNWNSDENLSMECEFSNKRFRNWEKFWLNKSKYEGNFDKK